jgi:Zn-finger nucleic acid-binding protein
MKCPRDGSELGTERDKSIDVDRCPQCKGLWLDKEELDEMEATVAPDEDTRRATIEYSKRTSDLHCPVCDKPMLAFNYRAYSLELDACDEHGFWLDAREEQRMLEIMKERVHDLQRAASAEEAWGQFVHSLGRRSVWDKIGDLFRGQRR